LAGSQLEAWSLFRVQSEEAENLHRLLSRNRHLPTDPAHRFTAAIDEGIYVKIRSERIPPTQASRSSVLPLSHHCKQCRNRSSFCTRNPRVCECYADFARFCFLAVVAQILPQKKMQNLSISRPLVRRISRAEVQPVDTGQKLSFDSGSSWHPAA